ncbi:hypothetical protein [Arcticibacter sp. MXS-1]|uniref:hypothetical protein n=1 Tax=Arcticibacter sp. MXS-1 TaxID=3341726 RepID=UPI0035A9A66D
MKTIFDFNPTNEEMFDLFSYDKDARTLICGFSVLPVPLERYQESASDKGKIFDIALLLEHRNDPKAKKYWAKIPDIEQQYRWEFDDQQIPV